MNYELNMIDFTDMRPFEPNELPAAYEELLADATFRRVVSSVFPDIPLEHIAHTMRGCRTCMEFQAAFCKPFLKGLVARYATDLTGDFSAVNPTPERQNYTYISNHRDIVLDSGLLDLLLIEKDLSTVEIAIGDNLLIYPWIKTLVRINRSFIVTRSGGIRDILQASQRLSAYMHYASGVKQVPIWIAQREGRSKDSSDETQESLLKMFVISGTGTNRERLKDINLTPLAISYEYDPCDYLKAQEFQQKRDNPAFKKSKQDDLDNMKTGIFGYKGRVHYHCAQPINAWLDNLHDLSRKEYFEELSQRIDRELHSHYRLYPCNYIAWDILEHSGTTKDSTHYTQKDIDRFEQYLQGQLDKINIPDKDEAFLRERMLTMYANPVRNYMATQ